MTYPDTINLPFNSTCIKGRFVTAVSATPPHPDEQGVLALLQGNSIILAEGDAPVFLPLHPLPQWCPAEFVPLFIGRWDGIPLWGAVISSRITVPPPYLTEPFNAVEERMDLATLTVGGIARQMLHWERMSRFCSRCGHTTAAITGNWGRICSGCKAEHFPHIHPCAIVLVQRDGHILLVRKPEWAPGRYGLVAGFLDFGESLEECASREVREETGIEITGIRYAGSQNWPFPSQIMAGFVADYASGDIVADHQELEDARWFTRDSLPTLPPPRSIARCIIDRWLISRA